MTGAVAVTNPGNQANAAGTAITALASSATDTSASTTLAWTATGLPTGLAISSAGLITGTPSVAGTYSVSLSATDNLGYSGSASFTWAITGSVSVATPANKSSISGSAISALSNSATDSSSGTTLTWSATGLPTGLSIFASTGTISGTPTTTGTYSVAVTATDNLGSSGSAHFTWTITGAVVVTNPGAQSSASGTAITTLGLVANDTASGASFTWTESGLPTGLSINTATGTISGTPTTAGTYTVTVTATDGSGYCGSARFSWTVTGATITGTVSVTNPGHQELERRHHHHRPRHRGQ